MKRPTFLHGQNNGGRLMAVVSKEVIWIDHRHYEFKIRVLKDGLFRTEIPDELTDFATDYRRTYDTRRTKKVIEYECDTKEELMDRLKELRKNVKESTAVKHKVILYNIDVQCTVEGPPELREDYNEERFKNLDRVVILSPDHSWSRGMSINISAAVFIESVITSLDSTKRYSYTSSEVPTDERLPNGLYGELGRSAASTQQAENRLDWTQDRHDFFTRIYEAMGQLAWQLHQLAKPGNIDMAIEQGIKFLTGGDNDDEQSATGSE